MRIHNRIQYYTLILGLGGILFGVSPNKTYAVDRCSSLSESFEFYGLQKGAEFIKNGDPFQKSTSKHATKTAYQVALWHRSSNKEDETEQ